RCPWRRYGSDRESLAVESALRRHGNRSTDVRLHRFAVRSSNVTGELYSVAPCSPSRSDYRASTGLKAGLQNYYFTVINEAVMLPACECCHSSRESPLWIRPS